MSKDENKREGLDRYIILAILIIVAAAAIILRLAKIQIVNGQMYREETKYRLSAKGVIYPKRGDIYDRKGVPIAGNRMGYCAQYVDIDMPNAEKNKMLLEIINILEADGKTIKSRLNNYLCMDPLQFKTEKTEDFVKTIVVNKDDANYIITARQAYDYMRDKTFEIDKSYTEEETIKIMQLRYEILISQPQINNPLTLADDISAETMSILEENSRLRGVTTFIKPYREYYENARIISHVLGYVGSIDAQELEEYNKELEKIDDSVLYTANDIVGKMGIEKAAESILRGVRGETFREVDENGKTTASYLERAPVPGQDIYLTIDLDLQRVAAESLKRNIERIRNIKHKKNFGDANAGAVVVMDVNTGEILAMVSYPDFDPRVFLENDAAAINALWNNPDAPVVNRATSGKYAPGSTYKPLIAIAALESGIITPKTRIHAPYKEEIGNMIFTNPEGNQGYINLERALETSSNMFFYKVGVQTGIDNIVKWAKIFGFGRKTGIEIGEQIGSLASREYKKQYVADDPDWYPANTAMASIGQLYNAFTPIQLVNYVSTIANEGKKFTPHLIKMAVDQNGKITYESPREYEQLPISKTNIEGVKKGMIAVANSEDGTAAEVFKNFPFDVAGKTGTSETGREETSSSNGLFVCYAPYDEPEIAIAVVVEHGVWGRETAPICADIMMEYFRLNKKRDTKANDAAKETIDIIW
jgi:penicillin-binding protein 2